MRTAFAEACLAVEALGMEKIFFLENFADRG
jgi:hypothetical protein